MQVFQCAKELGSIESRTLLAEATFVLQVMEQLSTIRVWQAKI